jgi:exodeoxyribonuclease VII small subunit
MPAQSTDPEPAPSFEAAVERLEAIVEAMEADKLPLSDLLVRYEEGTRLVKLCQEQLDTAAKRIEIISRNAKGQPQTAPFDPEEAQASAQPAPPRPARPAPGEVSLF